MKEKLTKNSGLKLISLLCAFLVWLSVVNVANPVQIKSVEVPVTIINEAVLESSNLTYEIDGKDTVTIQVSARARDIYHFNADDFKAYADLSDLYAVTGAVPVTVEVLNDEEYLVGNAVFAGAKYEVKAPGVVHIKTEELQTKRFALTYHIKGTPAGNGEVEPGNVKLDPDFVYVKGPVSQIGQINSVGIDINVDGQDSDMSGTETPKFYDANGNELALNSSVSILGGDISYELTMLKVKTLPLDFQVTGKVADGYRMTGVECNLTSVSVAGLRSVLGNMSTLPIQSEELSVEGATADKKCEIDLYDFLPPGTELAGLENSKIEVTLKVEPLQEKIYMVSDNDIELTGISDMYTYGLESGSVSLTVRGLKEDLDSLSPGKMNLTADVSGLKAGNHTAVLKYQLDDAYEMVGVPSVSLVITEKNQTEEETKESSEEDENTDKKSQTEETDSQEPTSGSMGKSSVKKQSESRGAKEQE